MTAIIAEVLSKGTSGMLLLLIEAAVLFFVVLGVVAMTEATRRIPVQYAKQVVGGKVYSVAGSANRGGGPEINEMEVLK